MADPKTDFFDADTFSTGDVLPANWVESTRELLDPLDETPLETAAGVTPSELRWPRGHILRYIDQSEHAAILDGTTSFDASSALQAVHDAFNDEPGEITIVGTILAKGVTWTNNALTVNCHGLIKPADLTEGFILELDVDSALFRGIWGSLHFATDSAGIDLANEISALKIRELRNAHFTVSARGFTRGIDIQPTAGVLYNTFLLGNFSNTVKGVHIRPSSPDTGFCNENQYIQGQFTQTSSVSWDDSMAAITIDALSNTPNGNHFFAPGCEAGIRLFDCAGRQNHVYNARYEAKNSTTPGTDTTDRAVNFRGPLNSVELLSTNPWYNDLVIDDGLTIDHGSATRDTDSKITFAGEDLTDYFFPGQLCIATIGGSEFNLRVLWSRLTGGDTEVFLDREVVTTGPTSVRTAVIRVDGGESTNPGNTFSIRRADGNAAADYASFESTHRRLLQMMYSSLLIKGIDGDRPALSLTTSGTSSEIVLRILQAGGALGGFWRANGELRTDEGPIGFRSGGSNSSAIHHGSGTPEGNVTAPVGSVFLRTDGGSSTSFYVKESGTGNTGWVAK